MEIYLAMGLAYAQLSEAVADARRWKEAGNDPARCEALLKFERERSQRRHEMDVARASAPVTNITIRNIYS